MSSIKLLVFTATGATSTTPTPASGTGGTGGTGGTDPTPPPTVSTGTLNAIASSVLNVASSLDEANNALRKYCYKPN